MVDSLQRTLPPTIVGALLLGHVALLACVLGSENLLSPFVMVGVHLLALLTGLAVIRTRAHPSLFLMANLFALGVDHVNATDTQGALFGLVFIMTPFSVASPPLLIRGLRPVVCCLAYVGALAVCVEVAHPDWSSSVAWSSVVANAGLLAASVVFFRIVRRFAEDVDRSEQQTAQAMEEAVRARSAEEAAAEYTRLLHDTVVNTLGALARANAGQYDPSLVRARCRNDIERLESFQRHKDATVGLEGLFQVDRAGFLPIRRSGLTPAELRRCEACLPDVVIRAIAACATEAMLNAAKHSGADEVSLNIRLEGQDLVVQISDDGRGFDGKVRDGRGLAKSVFGRAEPLGIDVDLSTAPGAGTRVTLRYRLGRPERSAVDVDEAPPERLVQRVLHRFCWTWITLVLATGFLVETTGRVGSLSPAHLLFMLVALLSVVSWYECRDGQTAPTWLVAVILIAIPPLNTLALMAIDFGRDKPYLFQAGAVSCLLALLIPVRSRVPYFIGVGLVLVDAVLASWYAFAQDPALGARVAMVESFLFVVATSALILRTSILHAGERLSRSWRQRRDISLEVAEYESARMLLERWNSTGLRKSVSLLKDIANGLVTVDDPEVRRRCGEGERHLRQVSLLPTDAVQMTQWFIRALDESRSRSIWLQIRSGGAVVSDQDQAEAFGRLILECLAHCQPSLPVIVTLVQHRGTPRLLVVGDFVTVPERAILDGADGLEIRFKKFTDRTLVEARWTAV